MMMPRPMHFTLRGLPKPPRKARRNEAEFVRHAQTTHSGVANDEPVDNVRAAHHGWIDLLLGDTPLESLYRDEDGA